jgi:hypothetical protein
MGIVLREEQEINPEKDNKKGPFAKRSSFHLRLMEGICLFHDD